MNLPRLALVALAAARLTRFVTSDTLGDWLIVAPVKRWAADDVRARLRIRRPDVTEDQLAALEVDDLIGVGADAPVASTPARIAKGLECPFCFGFWIGAAVLLGEVATSRSPRLRAAWTFGLGAFALNYVIAHVSKRID